MQSASGGSNLLNAKEILEKFLDLQMGMSYADLGMGSAAHFVFPAADIVGVDGKVFGLDILKSVLVSARARAKSEGKENMHFIWTDLEVYGAAKGIDNESLDRISLVNLLNKTKQDEHVFNEANRLLRPGGKCLIIDWSMSKADSFGPPAEVRTSLDKVREMAKVVKWQELEVFEPSIYHFGIVFKK